MITQLKICGIAYDVLEKTAEQMQGRIGLANFDAQEIWIGDSFTPQTRHIAIVHETFHILSDAHNLALTEQQVKFLTHAFVAFVEDNPYNPILKVIQK
jgi:hypothetical protein